MQKWLSKNLASLTLVGPILLIIIVGLEVWRSTNLMAEVSTTANRAELLVLSNALLHEVQKERGMTAGFIGSNGDKFKVEIRQQRNLVDSAYQTLNRFLDDSTDELLLTQLARPLRGQLSQLAATRQSVNNLNIALADALKFYTTANKYILDFNGTMANRTPIAEFKQKFTVLYNIGFAKEASGIERALLSNAFANEQFSELVYNRWLANTSQQQTYLSSAQTIAQEAFQPVLNTFLTGQSNQRVNQFRDYARAQGMQPLKRSPTDWFAAATLRINDLKTVEDTLFKEIIDHANEEFSFSAMIIMLEVILLVFILALASFIFFSLEKRRQQSQAIRNIMIKVADDHDLTSEVEILTQDDLGQIALAVNTTVQTLRKDFASLVEYASEIATASEETASTTEQTNVNLRDQRSSIAENRKFAESLDASIASDITSIAEVSENAGRSREAAQHGAEQVASAVEGIKTTATEVEKVGNIVGELNSRVNDILGMVDVIRAVAEQTNLLALNAAIEAARAGEQGRGFAVVADEVRALAQRTQDSTEQISSIVDELTTSSNKAIESVDQGNQKAAEAVLQAEEINAVLQKVSASMVALDDIAKVVAESANSQQSAVQKMTTEMRTIDEVSQENAEGAGYIATAANQLSSIASEMLNQINRFRV